MKCLESIEVNMKMNKNRDARDPYYPHLVHRWSASRLQRYFYHRRLWRWQIRSVFIYWRTVCNDKRIRCFNYLDQKKNYKASIKNSKDKLFVIDNADILLDDKIRQYIAFDAQNQYVIIGRNPTGLMLELDEIYELSSENINGRTLLSLKKSF